MRDHLRRTLARAWRKGLGVAVHTLVTTAALAFVYAVSHVWE